MYFNVFLAYLLDLFIGDPIIRFHPVRLIGGLIALLERFFYRFPRKIIGGLLMAVFANGIVLVVIYYITGIASMIDFPFGLNPVVVILIYFLFCNRDMHEHAMAVYRALIREDIKEARRMVGRIVGRDTDNLGRKEIIRATVETIAENTVDGFISPLFYLALFGLPGGFVYKTVNTMDSMVGYRNPRYERFGKIPAWIDDILNYIPSRLNIIFLFIGSGFRIRLLRTVFMDGRKHPSPNSGLSEAAFSGFLGMAVGGPSYYGGIRHGKPWIGENTLGDEELEAPWLIRKALSLYWSGSVIGLIFFCLVLYYFNLPLFY